jgi:hypothetical protein
MADEKELAKLRSEHLELPLLKHAETKIADVGNAIAVFLTISDRDEPIGFFIPWDGIDGFVGLLQRGAEQLRENRERRRN